MPGSDRPNVLKIAQSVPGAWPTIPALMRLMSSQATFEPVSAKTQPVSGHTTCQIPDIENSCGRDSSRKTPPSVGSARFSSPKTRPLPANPRECRRFSHTWKSHRRDRTGWLGREDSNLGMFVTGAFVFAAACAAIFRSIARGRGDRRLVEQAPDQPRRLDVPHWALRGFVFRLGRRLSGKLLLDCLHGPDDGPLGRAAALGGVGDLGP